MNLTSVCTCIYTFFMGVDTHWGRQNGRHFPDDIFKCICLNETAWISIKISLKFVPKGPINKIPALVQIMAWRRSGDKPLSETMMVSLPTHICVTRPQWVNGSVISCKNKIIHTFLANWRIIYAVTLDLANLMFVSIVASLLSAK